MKGGEETCWRVKVEGGMVDAKEVGVKRRHSQAMRRDDVESSI